MSEGAHILVVDDDSRLRELLRKFLSDRGFRVTTAAHSPDAESKLKSLTFDLLVLDVMMPGETGIALTQRLRETDNKVPILLLTARAETHDRIAGLTSGADDYLAKPFEPDELLLRIRAILRRVPPPAEIPVQIRFGPFRFDMAREELLRVADGAEDQVRLTAAEASLLKVLAESAGGTVSRDDLLKRSRITGSQRTVDVQMTRLRRKVETNPRQPRYLQTVRGAGYVLRLG